MNDKEKRLKELNNETYLSDQEYEEKVRLEDELKMEQEEPKPIIMPEEIPKPRKRSILEILIQKLKTKPATFEEIQQLKLDRMRAILKRDIAKANHERKNLRNGTTREGHTRKKNKINSQTPRGSSDGGLRKMLGTNDSRNYKDLTG